MTKSGQTPVMRQYTAAKAAHPDALLLFRMGDFYELFYDDAVVAARALDLTLTSRNKGAVDEVPMAGVPHHAASGYIQKLLEQGFKVALCEQMADPAKTKGIVPREVVRVVTPGIVYDDASLDARRNHFLVALEEDIAAAAPLGIAALDLSTGELTACEASDTAAALAEIVRLDPREVLVGPDSKERARALESACPRAVIRSIPSAIDDAHADAVLGAQLGEQQARAACPSAMARRAAARCVEAARASEAGRPVPIGGLAFYVIGEIGRAHV